MRVVIATYQFLPDIGGVSATESVLAAAFAGAGHDVTVVTLTPGPLEGYGYTVVRDPKPRELFKLYQAADLLILSNLALRLIYPLLILRRPFALRHHSESAFHLSKSLFSPDVLRRLIASRAKHFVTSHFIGRVSGLQDWVVTSPFANPDFVTPEIIREPRTRSGAFFAGRLEPEKGIHFMLERWPLIRASLGVSELRIAGNGSLAAVVRERIAEGFHDITFLGGLSRKDTAEEMGKAAYILVPSLWEEPFGGVALEGLAAGAVAIVADRGGLAEAGGDLAYLYDPDDDTSFSAALGAARRKHEEILSSSEAWTQYREQTARHLAAFQPASVVQRIIDAMDAH